MKQGTKVRRYTPKFISQGADRNAHSFIHVREILIIPVLRAFQEKTFYVIRMSS